MKIDFTGKTVLVTGAGHGLGRAIAQKFAECGGTVWICDVNEAGLQETAGTRMTWRKVDVSKRDAVTALIKEIGAVDVLVNNAGGVAGQAGRPLEAISEEDWRVIFDINVNGAFWFSQAVAPAMKAAKKGRIVNISSGAGIGVSLTGIQAYASAKAALIGLTRQLGHELGPFGITVNSVAPGFIRSNPTTEKQWEAYGAEGQKALVDRIALKRTGTPDDIAHAVLFFASDYAGWITGQVLSVDGGK
jgi:3-oxoacyl-[acyl-carrier protein] reductase